jgi:hypothetical protein
VSFVHVPSWADFITTMVGVRVFGTHKILQDEIERIPVPIKGLR